MYLLCSALPAGLGDLSRKVNRGVSTENADMMRDIDVVVDVAYQPSRFLLQYYMYFYIAQYSTVGIVL
jgi:hypothetical protein